jgi:hypothetical protein
LRFLDITSTVFIVNGVNKNNTQVDVLFG